MNTMEIGSLDTVVSQRYKGLPNAVTVLSPDEYPIA